MLLLSPLSLSNESFASFLFHLISVSLLLPQVKSGTLFDNILISDDPEYAKKLAEETWAKHKDVSW